MEIFFTKNDRETWLASRSAMGSVRTALEDASRYTGYITNTGVYLESSPVYLFAEELCPSRTKMLEAVCREGEAYLNDLEEAIRTIPGDDRNGAWRCLGSMFTGLYYNEETAEVCRGPPK